MRNKTVRNLPRSILLGGAFLLLACAPDPAPRTDHPTPAARLSAVAAMRDADVEGYARAIAPRDFVFPADHGPHPDFKLEWWYWTGHLETPDGRRFGFQLTFFRRALAPPDPSAPRRSSAWAARHLYLAHFAFSDIDAPDAPQGRFHSFERTSRAAANLAGAQAAPFRVWLDDWRVEGPPDAPESFFPLHLAAAEGHGENAIAIDLELTGEKPLVLQGESGLSRKSAGEGNASYYYSFTRQSARGTVRLGDEALNVHGTAWLDREWSTSALEDGLVGWDWFSLQLEDGRDLMHYQLRREDGTLEPLSHGALISQTGEKRLLHLDDVELEIVGHWTSPHGGVYPAAWRLRVPSERLALNIEPRMADQELDVTFRYWEGAVDVRGEDGEMLGRGYVEMVGYADDLKSPPPRPPPR